MFDDPISPLSFVAGAAILTNACAIMQNGTTTRYNLAVTQWRDFRASLAAQDGALSRRYADPEAAASLAERRVRLQLGGLGLLNAAVALFAATTVVGLAGDYLVQARHVAPASIGLPMMIASGGALLLLLASTVSFFRESACARALLGLHRRLPPGQPPGGQSGNSGESTIVHSTSSQHRSQQ